MLLGCRRRGAMLRIEVWDTGVGIPEDQLEAIFEEYLQLGNPARERSRGLGLGLTMREIIDSGAEYVRKPIDADHLVKLIERLVGELRQPHAAARTTVAAQPRQAATEKRGRPVISVVDDEPQIRDALRSLLEALGYQVETFGTCEAFLARARAERSACLLLDVGMPGMDGLELQERLNADGVDIPVVIITGRKDVPLAVQAMRAGAVDFLQKPFDSEALLSALDRALAAKTQSADRAEATRRLERLTFRERDVMQLIVAGHANKEIAARLGISPRTAENHRARVIEKTGAGSFAELVRLAIAAGVAANQPSDPAAAAAPRRQ